MRILMPGTLVVLLWLGIVARNEKPAFYFFIASFMLMCIALIITVGVEVPIDNQIKTWTAETIPANWTALRSRWNSFHTMRTFVSIAGFISLSIGVVISKSSDIKS